MAIPSIADRRNELKTTKRNLEKSIKDFEQRKELLEEQILLKLEFKRPVSDTRGRKAELNAVLNANEDWKGLVKLLTNAEETLAEIKDLISAIDFKQRERQILAMSQLSDTVSRFEATTLRFTQAVDKFSEVRQASAARR